MFKKSASATSLQSVKDAKAQLTSFLRKATQVPAAEIAVTAQKIYAKAVAMVPYDTGKLERAIYVRVSKSRSRPGLVVGASAKSPRGYNYAGIQHENELFEHAEGRSDHYISKPFEEETAALIQRIEEGLRE